MKLYKEDCFLLFDGLYKSRKYLYQIEYTKFCAKKSGISHTKHLDVLSYYYKQWLKERGLVNEHSGVSKEICKDNAV